MFYNKKKKIKSSSLLESVVALTLISIVISISMMVFFNVTNGLNNQVRYHQLLDQIDKIKNDVNEEGETEFSYLNFKILSKVKKKEGLFYIEILVSDKGKSVLKKKYIVKSERE